MNRAIPVVLSAALLVLACCSLLAARVEIAKTYDLEYRVVEQPISAEQGYAVGGRASVSSADRVSEELRAEPKYASKRVHRGFVQLKRGKDATFALVLDAANGQGPPYDRLYLDANNDEDLTNDPVIEAADVTVPEEGYTTTFFPPVTLGIPKQSGGPYAVALMGYYVKECPGCGQEHEGVAVSGACYWEGRARFGDQERRVVLLDGDCNGLFDERNPSTLEDMYGYGGDQIIILPDADEPVEMSADLLARATPLTRYVQAGKSFYEIRPAASGASLRVYTRRVPTGTIRVNATGYRLQFVGEHGPVVVESDERESCLPVGKYRLREQAIRRTDAEGRLWEVQTSPQIMYRELTIETEALGRRPSRSTRGVLEVTADSVLEIPAFGPPLVMSLGASPQEDEVSISLSLAGENGDRVTSVTVNGERPPAPDFQIVSAAGKVIAQDQLEYG